MNADLLAEPHEELDALAREPKALIDMVRDWFYRSTEIGRHVAVANVLPQSENQKKRLEKALELLKKQEGEMDIWLASVE